MVKKLKIKVYKPDLLAHHYIDIGIQVCSNILIIAFLVCIIIYVTELNHMKLVSDNNQIIQANNFHKTMQRFINIMAWIMLCVIGLSSFISVI